MRWPIIFSMAATSLASDPIDVKVASDSREHCHVVEFPQGWSTPRLDDRGLFLTFDVSKDYEFRVVGLLGTRFLVAGVVEPGRTGMSTTKTRYTTNKYDVDLSNPKAVAQPASDAAWESGTTIKLSRKSVVGQFVQLTPASRVEYHGFQFEKSGHFWVWPEYVATRLSPDQAWLVLQSITGPVEPIGTERLRDIFRFYHGKIFFDIFNADTGKKILTIAGQYHCNDPEYLLGKTAWLTERYFIAPLGEHNERCLVCEFGKKERGK